MKYFQCFLKEQLLFHRITTKKIKTQKIVGLHFNPANQFLRLNWRFVLSRHQRKWAASSTLKLEGLPQTGFANRMQRTSVTALTPDHCLTPLQNMFSAICRAHGMPCLSPISAPTPFRLWGKVGYEHKAAALWYKVLSPHRKCYVL